MEDCQHFTSQMAKSPQNPSAPASFEAAMAELDALVGKMESGELPLEESLKAYQRGAELLKFCESLLKVAEQRIQVLDGDTLKDLDGP
jgi:exodeoxyribonuclease VII small subunit